MINNRVAPQFAEVKDIRLWVECPVGSTVKLTVFDDESLSLRSVVLRRLRAFCPVCGDHGQVEDDAPWIGTRECYECSGPLWEEVKK